VPRKAKGADAKVSFTRLNRVWNDVALLDWLGWLAEAKPECMPHASGPHVKMRCPFHDDTTASFHVTPYKGIAKCFGCHRMFWNPVHLIAEINATSIADALIFAKKRWGLSAAIPKELFEKVRDHEVYQKNKSTMMKFFADLLFQAMSAYSRGALADEQLLWAQPTVEYLLARRLGESARTELVAERDQPNGQFDQYGVWITICARELLGVFPPIVVVENHFGSTSEEFKFFRSYFAKQLEGYNYVGHLVLPYDDTPTSIARFKLREPAKPCVSQAWIDDAYEAEMDNHRGFYGLRYFRTYLSSPEHGVDGPDKGFAARLSEGEFDALAAIAQQIRRTSDDYIAIALSGGGAQGIDKLVAMNIGQAWLVPDRDKGGGEFVEHVLKETRNKTIAFRVFRWPDEYVDWFDPTRPDARIKDIDDAIREIGYPRWSLYVLNDKAYWNIDEWCYDQASAEIARTGSDDIQVINRIAKSWGLLLREEQVCSRYCNAIANDHDMDAVVLRRDILVKEDNEEEFIKRLHACLTEKYHPVGVQNAEGRKRILQMWNKASRVVDNVVLNDERSAETFVSRHYGPIYEFVAHTVGDPPFIVGDDGDEASSFNVTMKSKKYREYLNYALLKMAKDLPSMDHAPMRGQGIHMVEADDDRLRGYMINGRDVYHLQHDGDKFTATQLDGPRHEETLFDNSGEAWIADVTKPEDFAEQVDLLDLFQRVRGMIDVGWSFRHQDVDTTFLTAYVMCLTVMAVFTRQTAIILNAEHESGKSRFTSGFVGGSGFPRINVVAHAIAMQGYTAASIRQRHNNVSLCLCLEEFEDYGGNDAKSVAVRKVLELCRDLISESAVNWSIGTTTGESRTYHLRFPLVACAIRPLREAASLSRFIQFELIKSPGHGDPVDLIVNKFGESGIKKTRREMVTGLVPRMLDLRRHQQAIAKEYAAGTQLPAHASSRFREALYPVMSMLRMLGELAAAAGRKGEIPDYRQFAFDFADSRRESLARLRTTAQDEQIFETIMSSPIQVASVGDQRLSSGDTNVRVMLSDLNKLDDINKTKRGVYLDVKMEWLIVNWIEAQQGVLAQTKYKNETPTYLKDVAQRSPHHIPTEDIKRARTLERMVDVMGPCQPVDLISVFSVKHYLDAVRERRDSVMAQQTSPTAAIDAVDPSKAQAVDDIIA
jgi:hypothetical protein